MVTADMSAIASMLTAIKTAKDIVETMIGLRDSQAFQTKLTELQARMIDAQAIASKFYDERSAFTKRISDLEDEVNNLRAWDAEKEEYELKEISPGSFAYIHKEHMRSGTASVYLCANCYENRKKSILQVEQRGVTGDRLVCHACKSCILILRETPSGDPWAFA